MYVSLRNEIYEYAKKKYHTEPEYLWMRFPEYAVLRHTDNKNQYDDGNVRLTSLMKKRLQNRYGSDRFTFKILNDEYGIFAVRGPRGVPNSLSEALKKWQPQSHRL